MRTSEADGWTASEESMLTMRNGEYGYSVFVRLRLTLTACRQCATNYW